MTTVTAGWIGAVAIGIGACIVVWLMPLEWRRLESDLERFRKNGAA